MKALAIKLQLAEIIGTWIAAIAVIVASIFGFYEYLEHKSGVRVDRSMAFVERYHGDNLLMASRLKITAAMNHGIDEINQILSDPQLKPEDLGKLYKIEIMKLVEEESLSGSLEQVFTFYEQILLCRSMELCEDSVAENFFDNDGRAYIRTFYPYICDIRQEWNNPGQYERVVNFYIGNSEKLCLE